MSSRAAKNTRRVWASFSKKERAARGAAISAGKLKGWAKRKAPRALCRLCGKPCRTAHGKYCSKKCQHADIASWVKGPPRLPRRICPTCGKENKSPRDVHCSRACCVADPSYRKTHLPWLLEGQRRAQEPEVKERAAAKMRGREQTALLTAKGPEHAKAREYSFCSPWGVIYEGRNVRDCRGHKCFYIKHLRASINTLPGMIKHLRCMKLGC
jgi:endogenous inhibitor of DNA gyrase (YacG/DUF329 family)